MLPNLQNFRKPSKSQIIEKALEWVEHTMYNEERYAWQMQQLEQENNWLREHLHKLGVEYQQYNGQQQQQQHCPTPLTSLPSPPPSITSATSTAKSTINNAHLPPSLSSPSEYGKTSTMDSRNNGHLVTPHSSLSQWDHSQCGTSSSSSSLSSFLPLFPITFFSSFFLFLALALSFLLPWCSYPSSLPLIFKRSVSTNMLIFSLYNLFRSIT